MLAESYETINHYHDDKPLPTGKYEKCGYLCNKYHQNETPKAENRTEKHWHTSPETCLLGYEVAAD